MSNPATLIMRPKYHHIKQINTDYKVEFPTDSMLNNEIEKKSIKKGHKKQPKSTQVNLLSIISWY